MSLYGNKCTIDGVKCGITLREMSNGCYQAIFEKEFADLAAVEGINWAEPVIEGESVLPSGYGFDVKDIVYTNSNQCYTVYLKVVKQFLGDVKGYVAQVEELKAKIAEKDAKIVEQEMKINEQASTISQLEVTLYEAAQAVQTIPEGGTAELKESK